MAIVATTVYQSRCHAFDFTLAVPRSYPNRFDLPNRCTTHQWQSHHGSDTQRFWWVLGLAYRGAGHQRQGGGCCQHGWLPWAGPDALTTETGYAWFAPLGKGGGPTACQAISRGVGVGWGTAFDQLPNKPNAKPATPSTTAVNPTTRAVCAPPRSWGWPNPAIIHGKTVVQRSISTVANKFLNDSTKWIWWKSYNSDH